ncbi:MerR family transcriptional regulator [Myxococcota bacterium]|nr:MerR family transcriptional regulator [Myxococcota bacterium]
MKPGGGSQTDILDPSGGPLYLKLGEVARAVGVPPSTIRHWQEVFEGFLHPVRTGSGRHVYSREDLLVFRAIHHLVHREGLGSREARRRLPEILKNPEAFLRDPPLPGEPDGPFGSDETRSTDPAPWQATIRELEDLLDQARQENRRLREELDSLVRLVSDWARRLEEEAADPPVSDPPG